MRDREVRASNTSVLSVIREALSREIPRVAQNLARTKKDQTHSIFSTLHRYKQGHIQVL